MKKILIMVLFVFLVLFLTSCNDSAKSNELQSEIENLQMELQDISEEKNKLSDENKQLQEQILDLQSQIDSLSDTNKELKYKITVYELEKQKEEEEATIQENDVTVLLTKKDTKIGKYNQYYVTSEFSVTNNTNKDIKGIQGVVIYKDMFGKEIMRINCDFTKEIIYSGTTYIESDLLFECNQFIDSHMKLYNTKYESLAFEYQIKTILFTDGTSKSS